MQAESELSDKAKRSELDAVINEARSRVLKALNLPSSTTDSDPKLQDLDPSWKARLRIQSKELLIDEELHRRKLVHSFSSQWRIHFLISRVIKLNLANEGLEARKKDEEVAQRKRKAEDDKTWEGEYRLPCKGPLPLFVHTQKHASSVSTVGVVLRIPARRRRRPKPMFLDKTSTHLSN
jgi:hypothetical protein